MSTNIEWTKGPDGSKGKTWPVVTGCSHSGSPGCDMCYAARMAATRLKHHPRYKGLATFSNGKASWTGEVRFNRDVLGQPLRWKKPRMVFVASMGDWLHPHVHDSFIHRVLDITQRTPQHVYQFLTKRASRLPTIVKDWMLDRGLCKPPQNIWQGVSIENQDAADERTHWLLQTPAAVRFVSVEPMLSAVNITDQPWWDWRYTYDYYKIAYPNAGPLIDWVICGGESGPGARPMRPDWARSLRDQCQAAGVPFFFKQWGEWMGMDYTGARIAGDGAECFRWSGVPMPPFLPGESIGKNHRFDQDFGASRIGKKRAGHLLDGRAWQEFPADGAGNK